MEVAQIDTPARGCGRSWVDGRRPMEYYPTLQVRTDANDTRRALTFQ